MYVDVLSVMNCLYSAVTLTLVREQRLIRIIHYSYQLCCTIAASRIDVNYYYYYYY